MLEKTLHFIHKHRVLSALILALLSLVILVVLFFLYVLYLLPLPAVQNIAQNYGTTKIYDRNGELLYEVFQPGHGKKSYVKLNEIPKTFIQATLAAEDSRFYEHGGVDMGAIARAVFFNVRELRVVSGASTITQQLARNMFEMGQQRGYIDKVMEVFYALRLSQIYSKDEILEQYLNTIYYGNLAYGAESAALDFFGKHIYDLDLAESTLLAGLPQSPSAYNPFVALEKAKKRQKYVLDQMVKNSFLTEQDALAAFGQPIKLRKNTTSIKAPHFVQYVMQQLDEQISPELLKRGGFSVYTTLDYNLQLMAEKEVSLQVKRLTDKDVTNGALLSINPKNGQILAWVGSENYFDESIDGAVDIITSLRQPGSALKPFNYLLAFENGLTPASVIYDIPTEFRTDNGPYAPKNYDLKYHGPIRVREALASSFNIPAVKVLDSIGVDKFLGFLTRFGIATFDQNSDFYGLSLTLGGGEIRMIDLAHAYQTLANYGDDFASSSLLKITDDQGKMLYEWQIPQKKNLLGSFGREHAYQIIDILKDPNARLKGFGSNSVLELSREAAVKTGTTRNFRDNWAFGFTPNLLTAVWVGNADAQSMNNITGVDGAGPIWHNFMEAALSFEPEEKFIQPKRLKQIEICAISGLLPTDLCTDRVFEWFVPGSEPKELDNYYQKNFINKSNGLAIHPACESMFDAHQLEEKIFINYPTELQPWSHENGFNTPTQMPCSLAEQTSNTSTQQHNFFFKPNNNDEYELVNNLPIQQQKIPFEMVLATNVSKVEYQINEEKFTINQAPFKYYWVPKKGKHTLRAVIFYSDGSQQESETVHFEVH